MRMTRKAMEMFEKGVMLEGLGEQPNLQEALRCYRQSAMLGNSKAQFFLALFYAVGQNGSKNHRLALAWFKRAAYANEELCEMAVGQQAQTIENQIKSFEALLNSL